MSITNMSICLQWPNYCLVMFSDIFQMFYFLCTIACCSTSRLFVAWKVQAFAWHYCMLNLLVAPFYGSPLWPMEVFCCPIHMDPNITFFSEQNGRVIQLPPPTAQNFTVASSSISKSSEADLASLSSKSS